MRTRRAKTDCKMPPFRLQPGDGRPLVRQVLDGIREAVSDGYYRPGDPLPDYRALAAAFGVSPFVTKMAIRRLALEGILEARPSRGTFVRGIQGRTWRGHVVFVRMEAAVNPFLSAVAIDAYLAPRYRPRHVEVGRDVDAALVALGEEVV